MDAVYSENLLGYDQPNLDSARCITINELELLSRHGTPKLFLANLAAAEKDIAFDKNSLNVRVAERKITFTASGCIEELIPKKDGTLTRVEPVAIPCPEDNTQRCEGCVNEVLGLELELVRDMPGWQPPQTRPF